MLYYFCGANLAQNIQDPGFGGAIYRFTGKGDSPNTGLYYFGARFYDPKVGRFITLDPARDGLNWYGYCGSNPLVYVDPDGRAYLERREDKYHYTPECPFWKSIEFGLGKFIDSTIGMPVSRIRV